ncbi:MAG: polysaccharide biosynthesis protein, partial [Pyrinomonadaceae bacterium]
TVFEAVRSDRRGCTFIPKVPAAKITDVANVLMGENKVEVIFTGIRPGEKIHEIMVSEEECFRTIESGDYYVILPVLPELRDGVDFEAALTSEYSSRNDNIAGDELLQLLTEADSEIRRFATN